jgi:kumamolisin
MSPSTPKRSVLARSERKAPRHAKRGGRTDANKVISVSLIVKRKNPLHLKELGGRVISHEEFAEKYAADPASFDALRQFAHQNGLAVDESASSLARRTIVLRGPVKAMEKAFGVEIHDYSDETTGHTFHGFEGPVSLPDTHAGLVESVLGLDARPVARPHFRRVARATPQQQQQQDQSFNPPQVAALYNFPTAGNGAGQAIGIIELGGGYNASDLTEYFGGIGITTPNVVAVSVDGGTNSPGDPNGADGEVALDIEVAGSIAPGATIAVYFTPNTDQGFVDAITTAVHDTTNNPKVISISWGGPESGWAQSDADTLDGACQSAAALGVTITVASGDNGSSDGVNDGANHVDFPASSPNVLACGGTTLTVNGTTIVSEVVWDDQPSGGGASGGGVSDYFPLPSWQANAGVPAPTQSGGGRGVPDVAGDASPETGYNVYFDGQSEVVGGTSAVAPLWAALITLVNQQLVQNGESTVGFVNALLYGATGDFNDITQGNNGSFTAGPGWDACTGLGSPNGQAVTTTLS